MPSLKEILGEVFGVDFERNRGLSDRIRENEDFDIIDITEIPEPEPEPEEQSGARADDEDSDDFLADVA